MFFFQFVLGHTSRLGFFVSVVGTVGCDTRFCASPAEIRRSHLQRTGALGDFPDTREFLFLVDGAPPGLIRIAVLLLENIRFDGSGA